MGDFSTLFPLADWLFGGKRLESSRFADNDGAGKYSHWYHLLFAYAYRAQESTGCGSHLTEVDSFSDLCYWLWHLLNVVDTVFYYVD